MEEKNLGKPMNETRRGKPGPFNCVSKCYCKLAFSNSKLDGQAEGPLREAEYNAIQKDSPRSVWSVCSKAYAQNMASNI